MYRVEIDYVGQRINPMTFFHKNLADAYTVAVSHAKAGATVTISQGDTPIDILGILIP